LHTPEISVLVPFRDSETWIGEAVRSLTAQTFEDFEAVFVDDCSSDGSLGEIESSAGGDSRFRVIRPGTRGIVEALNAGLEACRGTWIARFDSDDTCDPRRLEMQRDLALERGSGCVVSCLVRCTGDIREGWRTYEQWINSLRSDDEIRRSIFIESPLPHPSAFYSRSGIIEAGGYAEGRFPEDYDLWLRLWSAGFTFWKVPEVLVDWRDSPGRLSRVSGRYSDDAFLALKAGYVRHAPALGGGTVVHLWGAGPTGKRFHDHLRAAGISVEAFIDVSPGRIGGTTRGRPVIGLETLAGMPRLPVLVCVRSRGAREVIRGLLATLGRREWIDYVMCT
jgi:glycosyltransferase involved in cell wall biosynthesis